MDDEVSESQPEVLRVHQTRRQTQRFYNRLSRYYDRLAEKSEGPLRRVGLEMLAVASGERVLEIGCGTGRCLVQLAERVGPAGHVFGIDLSQRMAAASRRLLAEEGLEERVTLTCGDALHLPFRAGSLDAVFMSFTLELFDTPEIPEVLAECRRGLRGGGRIGVVALSKERGKTLALRAFEWAHRLLPAFFDCRPIYPSRALEDAGFELRERRFMKMSVPVELVVASKNGRGTG